MTQELEKRADMYLRIVIRNNLRNAGLDTSDQAVEDCLTNLYVFGYDIYKTPTTSYENGKKVNNIVCGFISVKDGYHYNTKVFSDY